MNQSATPNLLFVFADQMRASAMGCSGNADVQTPTMDRLAQQGVRCVNHIANTPVCGPNRASLLTGTYPLTHGVVGNDLAVRTDLPSFGSLAKAHGYHAGYIGKWHVDGLPRDKFTPPGPRRLGFDDTWAVFNCTHDYMNPRYFTDTPELVTAEGYEPVVQTDMALDYLDQRADDGRPFCLMLSWGPPHDPYAAVPEMYRELYDPDVITLSPNVQAQSDNPLATRWKLDCRRTIADYYAAVTALDDQLAKLLDRLDTLGLSDDTLVVFCSDHGDMLWSHGWMKKQSPYEESIAVPLLMRWPNGLPSGSECDALIGTVDLLPTLGGLLGWELPVNVEGRDLSAALRGNSPAAQEKFPGSVLIANHVDGDEAAVQGMPTWRGVRTATHTYAERAGRRPWLLFDNVADPDQMNNLIDQPGAAACRGGLQQELTTWLECTRDPADDADELLAHLNLTEIWATRERAMNL